MAIRPWQLTLAGALGPAYLGQPPTGALSEVIHVCQRNRGTREISYHPTKKITPLMGVL